MVGVPRSKGCAVCIKRRVKCDENRPQCENCVKYGTQCPGYDKGFKFVSNKPYRAKRAARRPNGTVSALTNTSSSDGSTLIEFNDFTNPGASTIVLCPSVCPSVVYDRQCLAIVIEDSGPAPLPSEVRFLTKWFTFVYGHLGSSAALDTAARCFSVHHVGRLRGDEGMMRWARSLYVEALQRLQKALDDRGTALDSETMCACMLLCLFELFACTTTYDAWMQHASGIAKLIQARGPARFKGSFDKTMFVNFRNMIVMDDFFNGRECFLQCPAWAEVTREHWDPGIQPEMHVLIEDYMNMLYLFPSLVKDAFNLRAAVATGSAEIPNVVSLLNRTTAIYYRLQDWHERCRKLDLDPVEVPSPTNDEMYPVCYEYCSFVSAALYCGYYACMIILQEILRDSKYPLVFQTPTETFIDDICKSVEWNGQGSWGPWRMGFSMRVALEVAQPETKRWLIGWLHRFSKFYKVVSPPNYPTVEDNAEVQDNGCALRQNAEKTNPISVSKPPVDFSAEEEGIMYRVDWIEDLTTDPTEVLDKWLNAMS